MRRNSPLNSYFWLLLALTAFLAGGILFLSWSNGQTWLQKLWYVCQSGWQYFFADGVHLWQLTVPVLIALIALRGIGSAASQARASLKLGRLFRPFQQTPPARVQALFKAYGVSPRDVVFLNISSQHAFCLGFWKPQIWLTAGICDLLSVQELTAVVAHEAHHYHQRDPLQLLITRSLRSAFFFLPLVNDLARASELQQEVAADQAAIALLGDDFPLLCAIQKLLQADPGNRKKMMAAPITPFNITEARLRRLVQPPPPLTWRSFLPGSLINLGVIMVLSSIIFLSSAQSAASHQAEIGPCLAEPLPGSQPHLIFFDYNW